jgi:hypothetical protein
MPDQTETRQSMIIEQNITGEKRTFILKSIEYGNGYFISISEGEPRIGSITVSLSITNKSSSAKVIQDKHDQLFVDTLSKRISMMTNGICIISLYTKNKLELDEMKMLNEKTLSIIEGNDIKRNE